MADGDRPSAVSGAFRLPFPEQIAFFRRKLGDLVPTQAWDDLVAAEHDSAFMVAGAAKADLLSDLAAAVDKAIAEGQGIEAFRRDFKSIVARHGWTGWTGEGSLRGEAWRVRTILSTNAYTSYAAGRMAQLKAGDFAFWVYRHGGSLEPRLSHLSWNGLTLPPDHPFWSTHYPPSDWGCSCYVVGARSERAARRLGGDPAKQLPAGWDSKDPRTGAPIGIGKGWNYAPGASVADKVNGIAWKIGKWETQIAKAVLRDLPAEQAEALSQAYRALPSTADDARRFAQRTWEDRPQPPAGRTLGMLHSEQVSAIAAQRELNARGFDFLISPDEAAHIRREHGDDAIERARGQRAVTPEDFALLPRIASAAAPRFVGLSKNRQLPVFESVLQIGGEEFVARWEFWKKRRSLVLLNLFVRTGARA